MATSNEQAAPSVAEEADSFEHYRAKKAALATGGNAAVAEFLRLCRTTSTWLPADVLAAAKQAVASPSYFGPQVFDIYEQGVVAALRAGSNVDAYRFLALLRAKFPASERTAHLTGLLLEAEGKLNEAVVHYDATIDAHPTGLLCWQRKLAIMKQKGDDVAVARELAAYLKVHSGDAEGWLEMCDLQLTLGRASQAAFCLEELLLASPRNGALHAKLAEVLLAVGGRDALRSARLHASEAVRLTSGGEPQSQGADAPPSDPAGGRAPPSAWPLVLLADACFLHFCDAVGLKAAAKETFSPQSATGQEERLAAAARLLSRGGGNADAVASSSSGAAPSLAKSVLSAYRQDAVALEEDLALHACALQRLHAQRRRLGEGGSQPDPGAALGKDGATPPAVVLVSASLLPSTLALLGRQAEAMQRVADAAA